MIILPSARVFLITNLLGLIVFVVVTKLLPTIPMPAFLLLAIGTGIVATVLSITIDRWIRNGEK